MFTMVVTQAGTIMIVTQPRTIHCLLRLSHLQGQSTVWYDYHTGKDNPPFIMIVAQAGTVHCYH